MLIVFDEKSKGKIHTKSMNFAKFSSGFPESNPVEECWNQGENSILGSKFYDSFDEFRKSSIAYFRTRRFKLDLYKYLCR